MDKNILKEIDDIMQLGYSYSMEADAVSACNEWKKVWNAVVSVMDTEEYKYIETFDKEFNGTQCVFNWASDYEMELATAARDDISFSRVRIDFCTEYIKRSRDGLNILNMKRSVAESYFIMGMTEEGEKAYKALITENPEWGWGWIGWSDEYVYTKANHKNPIKAIEILEQALGVDGIDEEHEIKLRLKQLYKDNGMTEKADSVVIDESGTYDIFSGLAMNEPVNVPRNVTKIGRNEPCPCGSGKKYKKCCL